MNNDGFGQVGAGWGDSRILAENYPSGSGKSQQRVVRASSGGGGPMKERADSQLHDDLHHHLNMERARHAYAAHYYEHQNKSAHHETS
jgi:hypothetical protein